MNIYSFFFHCNIIFLHPPIRINVQRFNIWLKSA